MDNSSVLQTFQQQVKESQQLWALQDKASQDWVVMDSLNFEDSEVMPVWSTQAQAQTHCIEEWENYQAAPISIADWLEFWVDDLIADNILIGINWLGDENDVEIDLQQLSELLAEVETL